MDTFPMRIFKFSHDFNPRIQSPFVLVWIILPKIPYCLFHKVALTQIVQMVGKPLKLGEAANMKTRPTLLEFVWRLMF